MKFQELRPPPGKLQYFAAWTATGGILFLNATIGGWGFGLLYIALCVLTALVAVGVAAILLTDRWEAKLRAAMVLRRPIPTIVALDYAAAFLFSAAAAYAGLWTYAVLASVGAAVGLALRWRLTRLNKALSRH